MYIVSARPSSIPSAYFMISITKVQLWGKGEERVNKIKVHF